METLTPEQEEQSIVRRALVVLAFVASLAVGGVGGAFWKIHTIENKLDDPVAVLQDGAPVWVYDYDKELWFCTSSIDCPDKEGHTTEELLED